jgi:subtilisin family serine protease
LKVLPRDGQEFDAPAYYRALRYVIGRAQVLNLSLGGEKDPAEIDVLDDVIAAGVVVVAAMGNEYDEGNPIEYPAAIPEVCAVGATNELDRRAASHYGPPHRSRCTRLWASSQRRPRSTTMAMASRTSIPGDGTSMATPHVAGAARSCWRSRPE